MKLKMVVLIIVLALMTSAQAAQRMPHFSKISYETVPVPLEMKHLQSATSSSEKPHLLPTTVLQTTVLPQSVRLPGFITALSASFTPVIAKGKAMLVSSFQARGIDASGFQDVGRNIAILSGIGGFVIVLQIIMIGSSVLRNVEKLVDGSSSPRASGEGSTEQVELKIVEALPIYTIFDCFMMRPEEEQAPVRLQGRIVARSGSIKSPIASEDCVFIRTSARQDGLKVPPVEFYKNSLEFELELSSRTRIRIRGDQITLFSMMGGKGSRRETIDVAQKQIEGFRTLSEADPAISKLDGSTVFQFMERYLHVGAVVTCVGKLRYVGKDNWVLLPCNMGGDTNPQSPKVGGDRDSQAEAVWVSDNLTLVNPDVTMAHSEYDLP